MTDSTSLSELPPEPSDSSSKNIRREALIAFLGAGMTPTPAAAQLVSVLATARRSVAALQSRGEPLYEWLNSECRLRGVRENAATLATMEVPGMRDQTAHQYRQAHPDRAEIVTRMLRYL
jgi:hypothetical protein